MWRQLESGRVVHRFEWVVLVAALALIPVLVIEADVEAQGWRDLAAIANWVIWSVFVAELAFVVAVAPRKAAALRAHWLDVAIVLLTVPALGSFLSALRLARLARLFRLLRLAVILGRALQAERVSSGAAFRLVGLMTALVVVVAGAAQSLVDEGAFPTIWDGIWWAVATVTTVGYGDLYPRSIQGRILAMLVMLFGIGFLSVLTAAIASRFVRTDTDSEEILAKLTRIESELAEVKRRLARAE